MIAGRRPFTEMFEVCQNELVREAASNQDAKYQGFINQVYVNELASILPEMYLKKEAYITTVADYTTGTVTVGSGTAYIEGAGTSWTSADTNKWLMVDGYDIPYRMTYSADTRLTFQNSLTWVGSSGTGKTYSLFQDRYQLASDFAYMISDNPEDPNVVSRYTAGTRLFLDPWTNEKYDRMFIGMVGDVHAYTVKWISNVPYLFVFYAPDTIDIINYQYLPVLASMSEYTTGTCTFNTTTAVSFTGVNLASIDTSANTYYIRNDADGTGSQSKWTQIASVNSGASTLSLSSNYAYTSGTGISFTISEISKWPARFDDAILYKAAVLADPDSAQLQKWLGLYSEAVNLDRTVEVKRKTASEWKSFPGRRK